MTRKQNFKIALIKSGKTLTQIANEFGVHPNSITWCLREPNKFSVELRNKIDEFIKKI
jgi:hypothetical protein